MKKYLVLIMCALCALSFAACNDDGAYIDTNPTESTSHIAADEVGTFPSAKNSYSFSEIKDAFNYCSDQPSDMSTMLPKDMDEVRARLGDKAPVYVSDEFAICEYKCDNGGSLYVAFWDVAEECDYYSIEFVAFTMKKLCFDDFDSIQLHTSTLRDVGEIDPATATTYIDYGEEKYTTHLTKDGIVKINYIDADGNLVADSIEILHQDLVKHFYQDLLM